MKIEVRCECGKVYRVDKANAGKVFKCRDCDRRLVVREEQMYADYDEAEQQDLFREVQESQERSQSQASNPGMMRVGKWRYALAFPRWTLIWHIGLLASIALCFLSLAFIPLVLFFTFTCWMFWTRVNGQFAAGCVNPGRIVSLSPPLVAVQTDLRHSSDSSCVVVKLLRQPIHRMAEGPAQLNQRVATVAFYEQGHELLDHWQDFNPKIAHAVTADTRMLRRMVESLEEEDWDELDAGISQLSEPLTPGLYRVYNDSHSRRIAARGPIEPREIEGLIEEYLGDLKYVEITNQGKMVPHEVFGFVPRKARENVVAVIESSAASADRTQGLAMTTQTVFGHFKETGKFAFDWSSVLGALEANGRLTITLRKDEAIEIPKAHYLSEMGACLEMLITDVTLL